MNWIAYFEKYNSDCKLLQTIEGEILRLEQDGRRSPLLDRLRIHAASLKADVVKVDDFLDEYVACAESPRDASRRAQEHLFLCLRYQQDMTMEETAEAMCVSRDTAYRIRRRIIKRGDLFTASGRHF